MLTGFKHFPSIYSMFFDLAVVHGWGKCFKSLRMISSRDNV